MGLTCIAMLILVIALAGFGISSGAVTVAACLVNALSALFLIVLNIRCTMECDNMKGIVIWLERICSLFILAGLIYWRLFQFWGI